MSQPLEAFSGSFKTAFEEAAAGGAEVAHRIRIGGYIFRLRYASRMMESVTFPALEHLAVPHNHAQPDDFTFHIWDSASTSVQPPPPPAPLRENVQKGEVRELTSGRFLGHISHVSGAVSFFDNVSRTAIFWMADAAAITGHERAAPFLQIFQWCFLASGRQVTHAAAIGLPGAGALLAGRSGSGKSTTAALAHEAGLLHLADDYCVLGDDPPCVYRFYRSAKLHPHSLAMGALARLPRDPRWMVDEKNVLLLEHCTPASLPLKLFLLPRVTGGHETTARPATPAEALRALAPSTLFQLPSASMESLAFLGRIARRLPVFHLDLGTDPESVTSCVRRLLEGAAG
ncbi:MAG: hypothetical protein WCD79_11610 [Chthoniobacteraceae bacterium]